MKLLILGMMALGLLAGPARADVSYVLSNATFATDDPGITSLPPLSISFRVSDAAVARGTFALVGLSHSGASTADNPVIYGGNVSDFVDITVGNIDTATPAFLSGSLTLAFTFDSATKEVTSSDLEFVGADVGVVLGGVGNSVSGTYTENDGACGTSTPTQCHVSGVWTVPEPTSIALLLGFGLIGVAVHKSYVAQNLGA